MSKKGKQTANDAIPGLATISFKTFKKNPLLHEEIFGPFSLLVQCKNKKEMEEFSKIMNGQLTSSIFGSERDFKRYQSLVEAIKMKAGRVIFNGVPTGVEVNTSMHHGGPFPSTTDGRFTSVGTDAMKRFVRPIAYQNAPQSLLPDELKDGNPLGIWRRIDGKLSKE
jgi:2,5-dioxopentanoate dehydrogenase